MRKLFYYIILLPILLGGYACSDEADEPSGTYDYEVTVTDENHVTISGISVKIYSGEALLGEGTTDFQGIYTFTGLKDGAYHITGYYNNNKSGTLQITMNAQSAKKGILVIDTSKEPVSTYQYELTLLHPDNSPASGDTAYIYKMQAENDSVLVGKGMADANGKVTFIQLQEGTYRMYGFANMLSSNVGKKSDPLEVTISSTSINQGTIYVDPSQAAIPAPKIVIVGFLNDPKGGDNPEAGTKNDTITHTGPYEYIQLMALENIDFAVTPYAVVTCSNDKATAKGWAQGGDQTKKMNLISGTVTKGSFFYIGGSSKVIGGFDVSCGKSTSISNANWIWSRAYGTNGSAFDSFGNPGALMANNSENKTNIADGIAVFADTLVTATSTPIDAVFYGDVVSTAYVQASGFGYRIPKNDHYNPVNMYTGAAQPFFGQGTNTYILASGEVDKNDFYKLGGSVKNGNWQTKRMRTSTLLSPCPGGSTLADIEQGIGVFTP